MADYAEGSSRYIAYALEAVDGTMPISTVLKKIRNTGGSGIANERTQIESAEIRSDRGISDVRMGQNSPGANVPFEFSYQAFDDILYGAMGEPFKGGNSVTLAVDFVATGAKLETADASTWASHGVYQGDFITISDAVTAGNNGIFYISAITADSATLTDTDKTTPATITNGTADSVTIITGKLGGQVDTAVNGLTVAATGKTITAASAFWITTLKLKVGDWVNFTGFTNAGNNAWIKITTLTDTVLTASGATMTNETKSTGVIKVSSKVGYMSSNTGTMPTFSIEEGFTDIGQYHSMNGSKVNSLSLSIQPDAMITGEVEFQGRSYNKFVVASVGAGTSDIAAFSPMDSYTGSLKIGSGITESSQVISGIDFSVGNNLQRRFPLMVKNAASLGEGRVNVAGSINAFFTDSTLSNLYNNETEFAVEINPTDLSGNTYCFSMPRCKMMSDGRDISENDVTESHDFMALISNGETLSIRKQPATI